MKQIIQVFFGRWGSDFEKLFNPKLMIPLHSARKMSSYLFGAKLYPEERNKDFFKWGSKGREVCLNVNGTSTFANTVTIETYIINHKLIAMTSA